MPLIAELCQQMAQNPHTMTFSDIAVALGRGALAGHKSGVPGGVVIGAALGLSAAAAERVVLMSKDLLSKDRPRPQ